ncbi:hypothetical protein SAMN04489710_105321 [Paracidovorax konjaci]|uniref:Uncharacterized protein n=1 Tax=Paracidovorax konjaci TaxID=32040 RepID=A0A1I1UVF7_9BURK|nr:hypothetical protein SAMN04489710_105321 [Paracidovorax konjaci]
MATVKRVSRALCGALIAGALAHCVVEAFAHWCGPRFIRSDSDINAAYLWSLMTFAIFLALGAILGYR